MTDPKVTDILVDTANPDALDATVQQLGAAVVIGGGLPEGYAMVDGHYVVRVIGGDPGFIEFAINNQGYGTVVGRLDEPL